MVGLSSPSSNRMASILERTGGQNRMHGWSHSLGLHLSLSMTAMRTITGHLHQRKNLERFSSQARQKERDGRRLPLFLLKSFLFAPLFLFFSWFFFQYFALPKSGAESCLWYGSFKAFGEDEERSDRTVRLQLLLRPQLRLTRSHLISRSRIWTSPPL